MAKLNNRVLEGTTSFSVEVPLLILMLLFCIIWLQMKNQCRVEWLICINYATEPQTVLDWSTDEILLVWSGALKKNWQGLPKPAVSSDTHSQAHTELQFSIFEAVKNPPLKWLAAYLRQWSTFAAGSEQTFCWIVQQVLFLCCSGASLQEKITDI